METALSLSSLTAIILAGGLGSRLRSVIGEEQKVVASVAFRPFVTILLDYLISYGISRAILCVGYQAKTVQDILGSSYRTCQLSYAVESEPLGTAGALKNAVGNSLSDPMLLLNGDSFLAVDLQALYEFHSAKNAIATCALTEVPNVHRYGRITLDQNHAISSFSEKGSYQGSGLINGGVYMVTKSFCAIIPEKKAVSLEKEIFPACISKGLFGFSTTARFIDIGTPQSFVEAQTFFKTTEDLACAF